MNKHLAFALWLCACGDNQHPDLRCARIEVTLPARVNGWPFYDPPTRADQDCALWVPGRPTPYLFRDAVARNINSWNLSNRDSGGNALQMFCEDGKVVLDVDSLISSANVEIYFTRVTNDPPPAVQFDCKVAHRYYDYNAVDVRPGVCRPREDRDEGRDWPPYTPTLSCLWERE